MPPELIDEIVEQTDGSAIVQLPPEDEEGEQDFYSNLAETISDFELNKLSSSLEESIEQDQEARKKRDQQYEEGIRRTGLGDDAPGGALFEGASRVVHPVLAEGCIDYAARAIREIFPPNGPVKTKIFGQADQKKLERARRKSDYLNWQLTTQIEEYRSEKEILLTQLPLGGSQYEKYWFDPKMGRIRMEFVPIDKVLLPYSAVSFYNSPRITHIQDVTQAEFEARVESGFYADIENITKESATPDETAAEKATDKVEGLSSGDSYDEDGLRRIYEVSCFRDIDGEGISPYVVHLDKASSKILAIYRNWEEGDNRKLKLDWWVEDKFIPWRGAYGIGLPHLIGGLAAALTGALRALLDSAHINNSPGAVKLKGSRASGANTTISQTEVKEIDAPAGVDDIRKVMMPMPFNPPSPVLFQLLDWVTNAAKGVVATSEEKMSQIGDRTPVGTTMAMIEQGSATYAAIHARLHESQRKALQIICRLNTVHPDIESMTRFGVTPQDFEDNDDVSPVSDPHIFSEAQRYAQLQEEIKLTQAFPTLQWNLNELARRALTLLHVDGVDSILKADPQPVTADPVSENVAAANGKALKASPQQDHLAHAWTHVGYVLNPIHQLNPLPQPYLMAILGHVSEHMNQYYEVTTHAMMQVEMQKAAAQGEQLGADQLAMRAARAAQQLNAKLLEDLIPLVQQAQQFAQSKAPKPPVDPAIQATREAAMAQIKAKAEADAARLDFDKKKAMSQAELDALQEKNAMQLAAMQEENKKQLAMMQEMNKKDLEQIRGEIMLAKNDADNQQHQMTELLKNRDDNQTAIFIEKMKQMMTEMTPQIPTEQPQNDAMLKQMQEMLSKIEAAKTGDALTATVEALRQLMEGQRGHQERTMAIASQLLSQ